MAHGDKRWIRTWRGRLKKSRNRTQEDWLAELHNDDFRNPKHCPQCRQLEKARPILSYYRRVEVLERRNVDGFDPVYRYRGLSPIPWNRWQSDFVRVNGRLYPVWRTWHTEEISLKTAATLPSLKGLRPNYLHPWPHECHACRRKWETYGRQHHTGIELRYWYRSGVPAEFRRDIERGRRAECRNALDRAKYDESWYDRVPMKYPRNAAWRYW